MRQIFPPQTSKIMLRFKRHEAEGRQDVLLNCCDHDPGGLNISEFLRSNLNDLARAVNWRPNKLIIERFRLNYDFIEAQRLTWIDNVHPDHNKPYVENYLKQFGARKVEANALVLRPALAVHSAVRQPSSTCPKARRKNIGIVSTFGPSSQEQQPQLAPERKRRPSWRDVLKVHPAAELFPPMAPAELRALGEDIKKNGLRNRIAVIAGPDDEPILIDGCNTAGGAPFLLGALSCLNIFASLVAYPRANPRSVG
jgi:hypothetical protein